MRIDVVIQDVPNLRLDAYEGGIVQLMLAEVKKEASDGTDTQRKMLANDLPVEELCTGPDHVSLYLRYSSFEIQLLYSGDFENPTLLYLPVLSKIYGFRPSQPCFPHVYDTLTG